MGVHGFWQLIESVGRPVTLESLEGKILAVDVSIWLNQALKGYRDGQGETVANAHLMLLFTRICKLLFYRIKPVFVFDGAAPLLKRTTLTSRRERKEDASEKSGKTRQKILTNFLKKKAINSALGRDTENSPTDQAKPSTSTNDIYDLPPLPVDNQNDVKTEIDNDLWEDRVSYQQALGSMYQDLSEINPESEDFHSLPAEIQHEILSDMKEIEKTTSWAKLEEMPEDSGDFSSFQVTRLLKKSKLSQKIENVRKVMNTRSSGQVVAEAGGGGFINDASQCQSQRVLSEDSSHFILIKGARSRSQPTNSSDTAMEPIAEETSLLGEPDNEERVRASPVKGRIQYVSANEKIQTDLTKTSDDVITIDITDETVETELTKTSNDAITIDITDESKLLEQTVTTDYSMEGGFFREDDDEEDEEDIVVTGGLSVNIPVKEQINDEKAFSEVRIQDIKNSAHEESTNISISGERSGPEEEVNVVKDIGVEDIEEKTVTSGKMDDYELKSPEGLTDKKSEEFEGLRTGHGVEFNPVELQDESKTFLMNPRQEVEEVTKEKTKEQGSDSDDDFLEVTITPSKMQDDELFPASIFQSVQDKEPTSSHPAQVATQISPPVVTEKPAIEDAEGVTLLTKTDQQEIDNRPTLNEFIGLSQSELENLSAEMSLEGQALQQERGRLDRLAVTVTDQMYAESQELLRLFGIPYLVSPSEAEAQCAELDLAQLTNGSITDDSDVWLFGGRKVYRNFFNKDKTVKLYSLSDIENHFGLDRQRFISIALVCGSDYTEGIFNAGPVTAMEILSEFPHRDGLESLKQLKSWWDESQKQLKVPQESKIKAKLRQLVLKEGFPSAAVVEAYTNPRVDDSKEQFTWSHPDLDLIREFASEKLGWSKKKTDELVLPVMKKLNEAEPQRKITSYFGNEPVEHGASKPKKIASKRVQRVVNKFTKNVDELSDNEKKKQEASDIIAKSKVKQGQKTKRPRKVNKKKVEVDFSDDSENDHDCLLAYENAEEKILETFSPEKNSKAGGSSSSVNKATRSSSRVNVTHWNTGVKTDLEVVPQGRGRGKRMRGGKSRPVGGKKAKPAVKKLAKEVKLSESSSSESD